MPKIRWSKYNETDFRKAIESSFSMASALMKLGVTPHGGNYRVAKIKAEILNISTSHFLGQGHLRGKNHGWAQKIPLDEILIENSTYQSNHLKKRLIKSGILKNECSKCKITEWNNEKISCELDHINGNNRDNRVENLRILCPNCHSQTDTFRKSKKNGVSGDTSSRI